MRFEFLFILIGNQANHDAYSNSGARVGAKNKDFSVVSQTELTRSLVLFVVQVANCVRLYHVTVYAGLATDQIPPRRLYPLMLACPPIEKDIAPTELARVII